MNYKIKVISFVRDEKQLFKLMMFLLIYFNILLDKYLSHEVRRCTKKKKFINLYFFLLQKMNSVY